MAKLYGEMAAKALLTLDKSFARANGQPLDASEVYYSLQAAKDYAATAQAYIGQKIVVIENGVVTHYSIENTAGNLKELGTKPVADGTTITIGADNKITLANIADGNKTGTYNAVLVNGVLTWVKPSETTVEGLSDLIQALTGRVDIAEADIDALQASVGVASKAAVGEEGAEGYQPAVAATGLHKTVEDEIARAKAAEKALGERINNIDFVDTNELTAVLEAYAKTADLSITDIAADDKVLSLTDKLISATVSLSYDEDAKAIKLYGKNSVELGSVDATPFIKDGMLENVEYNADNNTLIFTWNTSAGKTEDTVVLSDIIEPYTAGVGLELVGNEFKAKLADDSESFLTITADGIKLAGIADAIAAAKQEAIDAAATAAAGIYATQTALGELETALDGRLDVLEAHDHTTYATKEELTQHGTAADAKYATKEELTPVATDAANAKTAVSNLETRFDEIVAVGGEPNAINKIQVNGSELSITDKTVNIPVPTKFSDLSDNSGFDARITAAQNQADKGVNDASTAQATANEAKAAAEQNAGATGSLNTTVAGHTTTIGEHTTAIANLQNADTQHAAEYASLKSTVEGHTSTIATLATQSSLDAVSAKTSANESAIKTINETTIPGLNTEIGKKANAADVYTKAQIGTITEGKTIVDMINDAKTAATYDDTQVKADIAANATAIATETTRAKAAEEANVQAIADEIARADAAEKANAKAIADEVTRATAAEKVNADAIKVLNGTATDDGSVRKMANEQIAAALAGADADFDTLKEMSDWLAEHKGSAAEMNSAITANTAAIATNKTATETNAAAIAANTALITANDTAIKANAALIAANDTAIKANATAIKANADALAILNGTGDGSIAKMIADAAPAIATTEVAGIVKAAGADVHNGVQVAEDGTMSVASVKVSTLFQDATLVLNGGNASGEVNE